MELNLLKIKFLLSLTLMVTLTSCIPKPGGSTKSATRNANGQDGIFSNHPGTVNIGYGRILSDNPITLSKDPNYPAGTDFATLLLPQQDFITNNLRLESSCGPSINSSSQIQKCFKVLENFNSTPLLPIEGKWAFPPGTNDFFQVHTFAHANKVIQKFQDMLYQAFLYREEKLFSSALSPNLYQSGGFWLDEELRIYSNCEKKAGTAYFDPTKFLICLGEDPDIPHFLMSQDPTVIYHEVAHAFVKLLINSRNKVEGTKVPYRTDLGTHYYDEGGSINEGIADYFSYVMNQRPYFAEWALERFYRAGRPISEESTQHVPGLSIEADSRLSYPNFINYDSKDPSAITEDIHLTGQIASHYLVALTEEFKKRCGMTHDLAATNVVSVLAETLAELGDLTAKGTNNPVGSSSDCTYSTCKNRVNFQQTNLSFQDISKKWTEVIYPINFRRFFQVFAHNLLKAATSPLSSFTCQNSTYGKDDIEQLLDSYGLLLFKTYNDNGSGLEKVSGVPSGHVGTLTQVSAGNRIYSSLIAKKHIDLDPTANANKAFIFDDQSDISKTLSTLSLSGNNPQLSTKIPSDLSYNNGNGRIGPGEIVGIALNLYNKSNSTMGGVQVLASDWDHGKIGPKGYLMPCNTFEDQFPSTLAGAAPLAAGIPGPGDCEYITTEHGQDENEPLAPICFVQHNGPTDTKWVSQDYYRELSNELYLKDCLDEKNPASCYVRAVPGADSAYYSFIKPQKTWGKTLSEGQLKAPVFQSSNLILLEINPWTPPGTTFDCRFRVRFTNCEDCFTNLSEKNDNYLDYQYDGGAPFKIIHLQFTVID